MSLPNEILNALMSSDKDEDTFQVSRSLRFNSADSAYLSRTYAASPTDRKKMTISFWVKRASVSVEQWLFAGYDGSSVNSNGILFTSGDKLYLLHGTGSLSSMISTPVFRDTSAWYHIVVSFDMSNATTSNRVRVWVNNSQITTWDSTYYPNSNLQYLLNNSNNKIGASNISTVPFNGYLTEFYAIDGQSLEPSSFGQSDANGRWVPKAYTGTYGTNGFYLKFADNSGTTATTLGKDSSGNGNNWTPTNFSVTAGVGNDSLVDSPTNYGTDTGLGGEVRGNYATLNPIFANGSSGQSVNGNLDHYMPVNNLGNVSSVRIPDTGKWYAEFTCLTAFSGGIEVYCGVNTETVALNASRGGNSTAYCYYNGSGQKVIDGTFSAYGASYTTNDVIGIAVDKDAATLTFYKNGVSQGAITSLPTTKVYFWSGSGGGSLYTAGSWNFGQRPFANTAPTGFKALCTDNLPTPTIKKPSQYMNTITYTGTGVTRSITGVGFQPNLVWTKSRSNAEILKVLDSVRGATKALYANTIDEITESGITSFDSDGFTIDGATDTGYNTNTYTYVNWNWKKGVTPGLDIVTYTGSGSSKNVAHSLGTAPSAVIAKARTTAGTDQGWALWHKGFSPLNYTRIDSSTSLISDTTVWNGVTPNTTTFGVGTNAIVNTNNDTYVAYLWSEVAGFSRFNTYTGNASTDGPFVWCGFRPAIVMIKVGNGSYYIFDSKRNTYNVGTSWLLFGSNAETSTGLIDFLSNGFKIRSSSIVNGSAVVHYFFAFAETPFKYSRGR